MGQPHVPSAVPADSGASLSGGTVGEDVGKVAAREEPKIEGQFKTPHTPPGFAAPSSGASGSREEAQLRDCLAHLKMEAEEGAQRAEHEHRLRMRRMEFGGSSWRRSSSIAPTCPGPQGPLVVTHRMLVNIWLCC